MSTDTQRKQIIDKMQSCSGWDYNYPRKFAKPMPWW